MSSTYIDNDFQYFNYFGDLSYDQLSDTAREPMLSPPQDRSTVQHHIKYIDFRPPQGPKILTTFRLKRVP